MGMWGILAVAVVASIGAESSARSRSRGESPQAPLPVTREQAAEAALSRKVHPRRSHAVPLAGRAVLSHAVFGYLPDWRDEYLSEIRFEQLSHIAYFTGGCTPDGGYSPGGWPFDELTQLAHAAGTKVMLVVPCFTEAKIHAVLATPSSRAAFIGAVVDAVASGLPIDGVDLDFEQMAGHHLGDFPEFAAELAAAVRQVLPEAEFSAALPPVDWSVAYDYPALAEVLDHLIIMGYGYHWSGGNPGPVSPLDYEGSPWQGYTYDLDWSIDDYLNAIDDPSKNGKVLLGLPYYGIDWPSTDFSIPGTKTANGSSRIYAVSAEWTDGGGKELDSASQTNYFFYDEGGPRQLWFDDASTLGMKYAAAKGRGLGGVAIWAITYDAGRTELWDALQASFGPFEPGDDDDDDDTGGGGDDDDSVGGDGGGDGRRRGCDVSLPATRSPPAIVAALAPLAAAAWVARRRRAR